MHREHFLFIIQIAEKLIHLINCYPAIIHVDGEIIMQFYSVERHAKRLQISRDIRTLGNRFNRLVVVL